MHEDDQQAVDAANAEENKVLAAEQAAKLRREMNEASSDESADEHEGSERHLRSGGGDTQMQAPRGQLVATPLEQQRRGGLKRQRHSRAGSTLPAEVVVQTDPSASGDSVTRKLSFASSLPGQDARNRLIARKVSQRAKGRAWRRIKVELVSLCDL